jgi:hypothetical protein
LGLVRVGVGGGTLFWGSRGIVLVVGRVAEEENDYVEFSLNEMI